jgi:hypothetical protein
MRRTKLDGWYTRKSFPHFDVSLSFKNAQGLVQNESRVALHSYRPFVGYLDKKRKFTPNSPIKYKVKIRPIKYCSHQDGYIHYFYAKKLVNSSENYLSTKPWGKCVIGYRSGLGNNIHMAKNAFNEIRRRAHSCAIAMDIIPACKKNH